MGGEGGREPVLLVLFRAFYDTQGGGGQMVRALLLIKSIIILPADPLSEVPCGSLSLGKSLELSNLLLK